MKAFSLTDFSEDILEDRVELDDAGEALGRQAAAADGLLRLEHQRDGDQLLERHESKPGHQELDDLEELGLDFRRLQKDLFTELKKLAKQLSSCQKFYDSHKGATLRKRYSQLWSFEQFFAKSPIRVLLTVYICFTSYTHI